MNAPNLKSEIPNLPSLLVLVGPTAVGKTALSLRLAERLNAEIVSADSRYLYLGMDIGTAKPTRAERSHVPHHLVDVTTPEKPWSLAQVQGEAMRAIARIASHGRLPLIVGGAGQYIRAITEGWQAPGGEPSAALRAELQTRLAREGVASLAARLTAADPASAAQIDIRNPRRIIRALEVVLTTGQSFIAQRRKSPPPYAITTIGLTLPRAELYARIDARVEAMLASGLVDEVRGLADRGYHWELPAMSALGYRQIGAYLRGECDLAEAVRRIKRDTHVFVRRQANWFKLTDPHIRWFSPHDPVDAVTAYLAARIER